MSKFSTIILIFVMIIHTSTIVLTAVQLKMANMGAFQDFTCERTILIFKVILLSTVSYSSTMLQCFEAVRSYVLTVGYVAGKACGL